MQSHLCSAPIAKKSKLPILDCLEETHTIVKDNGSAGNDPAGRVNSHETKDRYGPQEDGAPAR